MNMQSRPIKPKWGRISKMKENYDYMFFTPFDDFENLSQYVRPFVPWDLLDEDIEKEALANISKTHEILENPLKEYVIFKAVAIVEQSFRNLLIFLIDDLKLNIQKSLGIGNKITIFIDDLNKYSNSAPTKGFMITDSISNQINRPHVINETFSKILKLDFHDTLKNLHTIVDNKDSIYYLDILSKIFENNSDSHNEEFEKIFQLRNLIAHNSKHEKFYEYESIMKNEKIDLHLWLMRLFSYVSIGSALVSFYGIYFTKFNNLEELVKKEIFPRYSTEKDHTVEDIKDYFEKTFGTNIEKVSEYIKLQQEKYKQN
jgi:hypothetical protein